VIVLDSGAFLALVKREAGADVMHGCCEGIKARL